MAGPPSVLLATPSGHPRARAVGLRFDGVPGPWNAITDVAGVEVGYTTIIEGDDVRTGVTAILPRGRGDPGTPCAAGIHIQNGNGELTGVGWVEESGTMSGPILLTSTHSVGFAHAAAIRWTLGKDPDLGGGWLLPIVGETWDGYLNDPNSGRITESDVIAALDAAGSGPIDEGSVGGGTGMMAYDFKAGSGTASRRVRYADETYTIGAFVQANFGERSELAIRGFGLEQADDHAVELTKRRGAGSCVAVVITDAPLLPGECRALARRVTMGLARTGTTGSHFSGDLFLGLSTANPRSFASNSAGLASVGRRDLASMAFVPWAGLDPFFSAVVQSIEEAVLNALVAADPMTGRNGNRAPALREVWPRRGASASKGG